jgi:LemA protein
MIFVKNKKLLVVLGVIALVVVILVASIAGTYNSLVGLETAVEEKQAAISTQLQRRSDLIPNLVNTVKGYAAHEEEVYTAIADARSKLAGATTVEDMSEASGELSSALSRLLVVVENYPQLKANENFIALQDQLEGTENRIAVARNDYNEAAKKYNEKIRRFPANIFAGMFGFEKVDYFEAEAGADKAPEVNF